MGYVYVKIFLGTPVYLGASGIIDRQPAGGAVEMCKWCCAFAAQQDAVPTAVP